MNDVHQTAEHGVLNQGVFDQEAVDHKVLPTAGRIDMDEPIFLASQIRAWERRWFAQGNASLGLMQQASLAVANWLHTHLSAHRPDLLHVSPRVVLLCGQGNNGGDGYHVASYLQALGYQVTVLSLGMPRSADACTGYQALISQADKTHIKILDMNDVDWATIDADVCVDALFGSGFCGTLPQAVTAIITAVNDKRILPSAWRVALDVPTGLNPDTGVPQPVAFVADVSLCLMGLKLGLLTGQGRSHAGQVVCLSLIPKDSQLEVSAYLATRLPKLASLPKHSHKGDRGHVYVIGGSRDMGGAVIMTATAAFAGGAGRVTVVCHPAHHGSVLACNPAIMVQDIASFDDAGYRAQLADNADSIAFGMGLGRDSWSKHYFDRFMQMLNDKVQDPSFGTKVILDADALYWLERAPQSLTHHVIATPHSAEAARLLSMRTEEIERDRLHAIHELYVNYGGQWVLKGAGSLVRESLTHEYASVHVCNLGNVHMAVAGMGDVLAGTIAGMYASQRQIRLIDCVMIHAHAGDMLFEVAGYVQAPMMPQTIATLVTALSD